MPGQQHPCKPDDLTLLPVTLNGAQRRMLFGPLKPLFNPTREGDDGLHQCAEVSDFYIHNHCDDSVERCARTWRRDTNIWWVTSEWCA